ncbi:MAG: hypothetical protein FWE95_10445, partial [Planctomycetaceae bacterium]|nr:hypothetical protein [Planctomycetaceae bacterium]
EVLEVGLPELLQSPDAAGKDVLVDLGIVFNCAFSLCKSPFHDAHQKEKANGKQNSKMGKDQYSDYVGQYKYWLGGFLYHTT